MADRLPGQFALGLRVLLVDNNLKYLELLQNKLQHECKHKVTTCTGVKEALSLLLENKDGFDIILTEFHMPDMDGLQLLDSIRDIGDHLPVVLFSEDQDMAVVKQGFEKGACDFLVKPIRDEDLKMIWKYVLLFRLKKEGIVNNVITEVNNQQAERSESVHQSSSDDTVTHRREGSPAKRRNWDSVDQDDEAKDNKDIKATPSKKPRVHWTSELQQKFVEAIERIDRRKNPDARFRPVDGLGEVQVVPKDILDEMRKMGVTGLTRQNVSSHLQKHRTNKKKQGESLELRTRHPGLSTTNYSSPGQYSSPSIGSNAAPLTAPNHHLYSRNFSMPNNYFSIGQPVGPLPIGPMAQQLTLPLNHIQSPLWSSSLHHVIGSATPANLQFMRPPSIFGNQNQELIPGPHLVNQSTTDQRQFIAACPYGSESPCVSNCPQEPEPPNIINSTLPIHQSFNNYGVQDAALQIPTAELNVPSYPSQHTDVGSGTTAATQQEASFNVQSFVAPTSLNQLTDIGPLGFEDLDLPWFEPIEW
ncbi:hypothetical protein CDL15_Pgr018213 [Punica granatum]|uniref:Response regulatory domain-containing protein n=1 Tax=Punica granatum TaxID=22663 RepID=A0A218WIJ7_PUNGR|nr:hypothetical protein CDL15_Pgr018213 [Punica granatum]